MTTDFRALCAELLAWAERTSAHYVVPPHVILRARAALSAPEQGATDEELLKLVADELGYEPRLQVGPHEVFGTTEEMVSLLRRALSLWSDPTVEPTDEQILAIQDRAVASFSPVHPDAQNLSAIEYARALEISKARAVLQHLGRPAVEPVPVSERLPGPEDCDDQGRCWWLDRPLKNGPAHWMLRRQDDWLLIPFIAWAPHWALPVPREEADG